MTFAIAGVSGNTGKAVAETLLERGKSVRVIVRDAAKGEPWRARGAEVRIADLGDAAAAAKALEGAEGAYLLVPPHMAPGFRAYQRATVAALAEALRIASVPHVVMLSSVGAQHPDGTGPIAGLHDAEHAFRALPKTKLTFLRAGYFMENLGGSLAMLAQGVLPSFVPAGFGIPMIATKDIGRTAASLLVEGAPAGASQIVELGGPDVTMNDAAAALSRITGRTIAVQEAPIEAMAPTLASFGFPQDLADLYQEMNAGMLSGHVAFEGGHRRLQGTTSVEEVLRGLLTGAPQA